MSRWNIQEKIPKPGNNKINEPVQTPPTANSTYSPKAPKQTSGSHEGLSAYDEQQD